MLPCCHAQSLSSSLFCHSWCKGGANSPNFPAIAGSPMMPPLKWSGGNDKETILTATQTQISQAHARARQAAPWTSGEESSISNQSKQIKAQKPYRNICHIVLDQFYTISAFCVNLMLQLRLEHWVVPSSPPHNRQPVGRQCNRHHDHGQNRC